MKKTAGSLASREAAGAAPLITRGPCGRLSAKFLNSLNVKVFLDAPCGDFNWMQHVELPEETLYIGGDIVGRLIEDLQQAHGNPTRSFRKLDIVEGPLPKADLWLCRDVLFHLPEPGGHHRP